MALKTGNDAVMMGYQVILIVNSNFAALGTNVSIDKSAEMKETSTKNTGKAKSKKPGQVDYTLSFDGYNGFSGEGFPDLNIVMNKAQKIDWSTVPQKDSLEEFGDTALSFVTSAGEAISSKADEDLLETCDILATPTVEADGTVKYAGGGKFNKGSGYLNSLGASYGQDEASTYSCGLDGSGDLETFQIIAGSNIKTNFLSTVASTETVYFLQRNGILVEKQGTKV